MNNLYYFSDDELALLASLLNGSVVYGVESKLFSTFKESYHQRVFELFEQLEEKKIIRMDYEGNIRIQPDVYDLITVLIQPTQLLSLQTNYFNGQKERHLYYKKDGKILHLKKGKVYHQVSFENNPPKLNNLPLEINETITQWDLDKVDDYFDWFDEDGAFQYLSQKVKEPQLLMNMIQKKQDELIVEYYRWLTPLRVDSQNLTVGFMNQEAYEWYQEDDLIYIQGGFKRYDSILEAMFMEVEK